MRLLLCYKSGIGELAVILRIAVPDAEAVAVWPRFVSTRPTGSSGHILIIVAIGVPRCLLRFVSTPEISEGKTG